MDKEAKKVTCQNPAKTMKEIADKIVSGYGADIIIDEAIEFIELDW